MNYLKRNVLADIMVPGVGGAISGVICVLIDPGWTVFLVFNAGVLFGWLLLFFSWWIRTND
jgi:hypothetical protein